LKWKEASYLSIEQQRRRDRNSELPLESYQLAVLNHTMTDEASKQSIAVRVMFVFSSADQKVVQQQRQKKIVSITKEFEQIEKSVAAGRYNTKMAAVAKRVARAFGTGTADRYFTWKLVELTSAQQQQLPNPARGCRLPTHRFEWTFDPKQVSTDEASDGYSAIVTTAPKTQFSCDRLFTMFREQNLVEHANRQFKGPLAVRPIFLHTPERVEALLFVLMIALMIYFLIQRTYREHTDDDAPQAERRTTTATILKSFSNYTVLIHHHPHGREVQPTRLSARQRGYLSRLQFPSPAQTLSRRLARPPD
jgi:transposase